MILIGRTPRLRADNLLQGLTAETDDGGSVEATAAQFLQKVELIVSIHDNVLINVEQAQTQQKKNYATRKGKHLFEGLIAGSTMVKMKKPGKRRALTASWGVPTDSLGTLMEGETSILRRVVGCVLFKMQMAINGRDLVETSRFFLLLLTE
jgi:hypothetical protein